MTKQSHEVPRFLIQNWADQSGIIHAYMVNEKKKILAAPQNIMKKSLLYGKNIKENRTIEEKLGNLESKVSGIINNIFKNIPNVDLTQSNKELLFNFAIIQHNRTQLFRQLIKEAAMVSMNFFQPAHDKDLRFKIDDQENIEYDKIAKRQFVKQINSILDKECPIKDYNFMIQENKTRLGFYLSDSPVFIMNMSMNVDLQTYFKQKDPRFVGYVNYYFNITSPGAMITLPFGPKFLLRIADNRNITLTGNYIEIHDESEVKQINAILTAKARNAIISADKDFAVAEEVVRNHPELYTNQKAFVITDDKTKKLYAYSISDILIAMKKPLVGIKQTESENLDGDKNEYNYVLRRFSEK